MIRPLKGRVLRKAIPEAQEGSNITSGFQKLGREPACSHPTCLGQRPKSYHLPRNKEVLSTRSSLLYCNHFSLAFFPQAGPRAEGKPSSPRAISHPTLAMAALSGPAGSQNAAGGSCRGRMSLVDGLKAKTGTEPRCQCDHNQREQTARLPTETLNQM